MVFLKKNYLIGMLIIVFLLCAGYFILFSNLPRGSVQSGKYFTPLGEVIINAGLPDSPHEMMLYYVTPSNNDIILNTSGNSVKVRNNLPSEADAPSASERALLPYGGLPEDAKLGLVTTNYIERINLETDKVTTKYPTSVNVQYFRVIDNRPVVGEGGSINIDLGDNGELLYLNKVWRTISPAGNVSIINASSAIDRLQQGNLLGHHPKCSCQMTVYKIGLGYYEKDRDESQEYLEPVWIFSGNLTSGDPWKYYVYARASYNDSIFDTSSGQNEKLKDPNQSYLFLNNESDKTGLPISAATTGDFRN